MRSLRFVTPGILIGKGTKAVQEVNKLCNEGKETGFEISLAALRPGCSRSPEPQCPHLEIGENRSLTFQDKYECKAPE